MAASLNVAFEREAREKAQNNSLSPFERYLCGSSARAAHLRTHCAARSCGRPVHASRPRRRCAAPWPIEESRRRTNPRRGRGRAAACDRSIRAGGHTAAVPRRDRRRRERRSHRYDRALRAEAETEKLWVELEKFLVVPPAADDDDAATAPPVETPAAAPISPSPPAEDARATRRREAEIAARNYAREKAAQDATLARQDEDDMYSYLKSTPSFRTVKENFVLPKG